MRIAMITTMQHSCSPNTGWGAERYIWDLVECLDKEGHEVIVFGKEGSIRPNNGNLIICENESDVLYKYTKELIETDIIHDFSATKQVHDFCQQYYMKSIATNFNVHYLYPNVHKNIVCVSDIQRYLGLAGKSGFEGTQWTQQVGYTGHLLDGKRVYLGINLDLYLPQYEKEDFILYFNSFDYRKGITIALDLAKNMGFNLILAGEVKGHPEHQQTFNDLKSLMDSLPNVKYFIDVTNEQKIELMQKAKALIFPSLFQQPFAVVVIEALACGTPVITTNIGAMPEMIKHGKTGFLCNTVNELSQAINNIKTISNKDCRIDMEKRFDRKLMTKEYIKLYEQILNGESW